LNLLNVSKCFGNIPFLLDAEFELRPALKIADARRARDVVVAAVRAAGAAVGLRMAFARVEAPVTRFRTVKSTFTFWNSRNRIQAGSDLLAAHLNHVRFSRLSSLDCQTRVFIAVALQHGARLNAFQPRLQAAVYIDTY
jgi:hypothetical protein